jgi:hypothetical protein
MQALHVPDVLHPHPRTPSPTPLVFVCPPPCVPPLCAVDAAHALHQHELHQAHLTEQDCSRDGLPGGAGWFWGKNMRIVGRALWACALWGMHWGHVQCGACIVRVHCDCV